MCVMCDEKHVVLEWSALVDHRVLRVLRLAFVPLIAEASGIMARLV